MADPNITLPSLPSAAIANTSDLMLLRQGSEDKKATLQVLKNLILNNKDFTGADILSLLVLVDGAGSGLDADLLDGQHGSFYQNASNLNAGTIPSARLSASDLLTLIKTVDGSGSGLDADLLDGQSSAFYRNASNLNAGTVSQARLPSATTSQEGIIEIATQSQVNAGTNGDLAVIASTLRNAVQFSLGSTGFIKLPSWLGGFTIQWGAGSMFGNGSDVINYSTSFNSAAFYIGITQTVGSTAEVAINPRITSSSGSGFSVFNDDGSGYSFKWFAIGVS